MIQEESDLLTQGIAVTPKEHTHPRKDKESMRGFLGLLPPSSEGDEERRIVEVTKNWMTTMGEYTQRHDNKKRKAKFINELDNCISPYLDAMQNVSLIAVVGQTRSEKKRKTPKEMKKKDSCLASSITTAIRKVTRIQTAGL